MSQTSKRIGRRRCGFVPLGAFVLAVTACVQVEPPEAPVTETAAVTETPPTSVAKPTRGIEEPAQTLPEVPPPTLEIAALQVAAAFEPPEPAPNGPLPEPEEVASGLAEHEVETGGASLQPTLQPSVQPALSEIERLIQVAEAGDARAQAELGLRYLRGRDVSNDPKKALNWSLKAARQGNAEAQSNVGFMYITGSGIQKNETEAVRWWQEAARQGLPQATFNLGTLYENGHGVKRDYEQAAEWYRLASAQGYAEAKDRVERLYTRGVATRPD